MNSPLLRNLVPFPPPGGQYVVGVCDGPRPSGFVNLSFEDEAGAHEYAARLEAEAKAFYETDNLYASTFGLHVKVLRLV